LTSLRDAVGEAGLILAVSAVLGFVYTAATEKGVFAESSSAAAPSIPGAGPALISAEEAKALFESGGATFIDSRYEFDFNLGRIKGAINIPLKDFAERKAVLSGIARERIVVAYCDGADCNSSLELAAMLQAEGFTNVRVFFGGWREWVALQLPTEGSQR
jgi:rhodanese-related sulfurtransferase